MKKPFSYALIRVVPRVERGECVNVGVILYCQMLDYLAAHTAVDESRLRALHSAIDIDGVRDGVRAWEMVCGGVSQGGPAARETKLGERFRWLTAPKSTIIQAGPVHMGMTGDPAGELARLMDVLVR